VLKPLERHEQAVFRRAARKRDDEHAGGAWKVAFADFCLALMSLFLVLWLMAARDQHSLKETMRKAQRGRVDVDSSLKPGDAGPRGSLIAPLPLPRQAATVRYEAPAELAALARALDAISARAGLASNVLAIVTPFGLRVTLHDTDRLGMFERGSAEPTPRVSRLLRDMGPLFAQMENQMLVVGHTDSLPYLTDGDGGAYSNWTLSSDRAMAARAQLLLGGMRRHSVLQVVGMADRAPLDSADASAAVNRRIDMLVLTRAQADSVAAMFGGPAATAPAHAPGQHSTP